MGPTSLEFARNDFEDIEYWSEITTRRVTEALLVIYCIIFLLGIMGNGLVIFILGFSMKKTVTTIWFLNLTIGNFIFICSLPLKITNNAMHLHWPFGETVCKLSTSIVYINLYATAYFLVALSVECWVSIKSTAWAQNPRRNQIIWLVAGGIWLLALVLASPRLHFGKTEPSHIDEQVIICFFHYGKQAKVTHHIIQIIQTFFIFIIPIGVAIVCYVDIYLQQQRKGIKWGKSFSVTRSVIVVFYLCWLPYHVFSFYDTQYRQTTKVLIVAIPVSTAVAFFSSCINPIIYIVMGYDFKKKPRPPIFSAFENVFGEDVPQIQAQHA